MKYLPRNVFLNSDWRLQNDGDSDAGVGNGAIEEEGDAGGGDGNASGGAMEKEGGAGGGGGAIEEEGDAGGGAMVEEEYEEEKE